MGRLSHVIIAACICLGLGISRASAECKICIGASVDGFGFYSQTDKYGTLLGMARAQSLFAELPTVDRTIVNVDNIQNPDDKDTGIYAAKLSIYGQAAIIENADIGLRFSFVGTGNNGALSPTAGEPDGPGGGIVAVLEQGWVDFHTSEGQFGVLVGRYEPKTGRSLRAIDHGTPFLSVARSQILPTFLTGVVAHFDSDDLGAAFYFYNDLNGVNDQDDNDFGFGLGGFYSAEGVNAGLTAFLSPESLTGGFADQDNELWVFIINANAGVKQDNFEGFLDATYRRDGWPSAALPASGAVSLELGATLLATDLLGVGAMASWTRAMDAYGVNPVGGIAVRGTIVTLSPIIELRLSDNVKVDAGYNWETQKAKNSGNYGRSNAHAFYIQFAANLESEAKAPTKAAESVY